MTPTNLEISKKLHDAGIVVESAYWWVYTDEEKWELSLMQKGYQMHGHSYIRIPDYGKMEDYGWRENVKDYPAPLACELAEMLPTVFVKEDKVYRREIHADEKLGHVVLYSAPRVLVPDYMKSAPTLADAMGLMLLHLKEKELI